LQHVGGTDVFSKRRDKRQAWKHTMPVSRAWLVN
jgi:hypothetical protein